MIEPMFVSPSGRRVDELEYSAGRAWVLARDALGATHTARCSLVDGDPRAGALSRAASALDDALRELAIALREERG